MTLLKFRLPGKAISEAQIGVLEAKLRYVFPDDYRAYLLNHGGGQQPDREVFSIEDGNESLLKHLFTIDGTMFDLSGKLLYPDAPLPADLATIGLDLCGNYLCLGVKGSRRGEVYFHYHDRGKADPQDAFEPVYFVARNFSDFIASLKAVPKPPQDEIEQLGESGTRADLLRYLSAGKSLEKTSGGHLNLNILQQAARYGNLNLLKACHEHGLPLSGALSLAARNNHLEVVKFLLSQNVDVNEDKPGGRTALSFP